MERQWLFYDIESDSFFGIPFENSNEEIIPLFLRNQIRLTPSTSPYNDEIDNILDGLCKFKSLKNLVY